MINTYIYIYMFHKMINSAEYIKEYNIHYV